MQSVVIAPEGKGSDGGWGGWGYGIKKFFDVACGWRYLHPLAHKDNSSSRSGAHSACLAGM